MHALALSLALAVAFVFAPSGRAQSWPAKPVKLVVNVPPGSSVDLFARMYNGKLGEAIGQPVLIDYRVGAAGNLGVEAVGKAAPDGYTFLASAGGTMIINPYLYKLSIDMEKDLDPVVPTARPAIFLVVRPGLPVRGVDELVAYARANPGKLNFGSPGTGTGLHIAAEMMLRLAKVQATHIVYKGAAQMLSDLLGGQIDFMFDPGPAVPHIKAATIRLLAVANDSRSPLFPDAPTMAETGLDVDVGFWHGVYAPAGTPRAITSRVNREVVRIMNTPEAGAGLTALAADPVSASPEEFTQYMRRMRARFSAIVREANIRAD